jgi:phosphatidylserine/phosphatidylglycerophosphate/cardiolipin synthase-like enzyme
LKIENKERDHSFIYENKNFFSAYFDDISRAKERIIIVSPVISLKKISTFLTKIKNIINQNVKVTIITKPKEELNKNQKITVSEKEKIIKTHNFNIIYKKGINNKFSLIDQNVIWYGSLNILGYNSGEEIAIRFENDEIANEFIKLI